jgi:hypothetical protein
VLQKHEDLLERNRQWTLATASEPARFLVAATLVVIGLWGISGVSNGFPFETGLIYPSDISPGFAGFFYSDPLRKFNSLFYHLSYVLGSAIGERGSFVPYQVVYAGLWVLRALLTYLIVRKLMPNHPALALFAGLFAALHAADAALNWIGQLNQFGFVFLVLLSFFLLLVAMEAERSILTIVWASAAALSAYLALWSHESPLLVVLAFPFAVALLRRELPLPRLFVASAIYVIPVLVFIYENAQRYLTSTGNGTATYQFGVARQNFSVGAIASDLWLHIENSLSPWHWPYAHFISERMSEYAIALVLVLGAIMLVAPNAVGQAERASNWPRLAPHLLLFACVSFGLLVASYLVILVLNDNRGLWRTEFLPSFAAACVLAAGLNALVALTPRRAARTLLAVVVFMVVGIFATFSGVNSTLYFHGLWHRQRVLISSILSNAPKVADGTLFVLRNIDPHSDPFGHNMWLDLALRLAYPRTKVAGIYFFADGTPAPGMNIDLGSGEARLLPGGFPTLFHSATVPPIRDMVVFDYESATGQAEAVPSGSIKIGDHTISNGSYQFCAAVTASKSALMAVRRYGPITAANQIACSKEALQ